MSMSALDSTKHFDYERKWQLCSDSRINSTKWSRGHDILSRSHELIYRGHDKTRLSEPNMSPPGCSKCFVWLFRDHLLFPVDDLWPTFCTTWMSAFWILNTEFDVPNFFFILKTWSCIFKNWIFAIKDFGTKHTLFENTHLGLQKNCHNTFKLCYISNVLCSNSEIW